jgi:hypothetical protein
MVIEPVEIWLLSLSKYECKNCHHRTSLRSGTIMQNSNLSFLIWYKTMFLMSVTKKRIFCQRDSKTVGLETL